MPTLTPPAAIPTKPHKIGNLPETLGTLWGAMEIRKRFIAQAWDDSREYWSCMRDLADLERRWAEAEKVWAQHIAKEQQK